MSAVPIAIKTEEVILENVEYNSAEELDEELQLQLEDSGGESTYHIDYTEQHTTNATRQRQQNSNNSNMYSSSGNTASGNSGAGNKSNTGSSGSGSGNNKTMLESEKRMRREIANSNERRRMQSINAGFQNLRSLLPRHEGEKLSKASILQQTSQYIFDLEAQKTQLLAQNSELKRQLGEHESGLGGGGGGGGGSGSGGNDNDPLATNNNNNNTTGVTSGTAVAIKKRKLTDNVINIQTISDSSDEGLGSMSPEPMTLLNAAAITKYNNATLLAQTISKEMIEVKKQLEKERSMRRLLEEELQMIKRQLYSVATAPPGATAVAAAAVGSGSGGSSYIPRDMLEHTENFGRDELAALGGTVSYVEIDEMTGQQQVVVCSSIEEIEADAAAEIITEDHVHEEVILSSNSSTESENEVNVNTIAKSYGDANTPSAAVLQPILQAAIKATPKVEVERLNEKIMKVKTEKIEQPIVSASVGGTSSVLFTRSRQNLETIVEAIRHLEGDHLFAEGNGGGANGNEQKLQQQRLAQEAPLALTNKQQQQQQQHQQQHHQQQQQQHQQQQRTATLAELRPFLQIKGNKQVTILTTKAAKNVSVNEATVTPTAIFKVQTGAAPNNGATAISSTTAIGSVASNSSITTTTAATTTMKQQCRPGVIVAKQLSAS